MNNYPGMKVITCIPGFFIGAFLILAGGVIQADEVTADSKPLQVTVRKLSDVLISAKNSAPADIYSLNHTTLSAEISGRVIKIHTETGENVTKGQKLASIDCRSYELSEQQAKAALKVARSQHNLAKKQFKRNQGLLTQGTIPRELYDQAEASKQTTLADIELKNVQIRSAQLAVSRCKIYAPFTGQITKRMVQEGQLVSPGTPLFKLLQTGSLEVKASLSPAEINHINDSPLLEFVAGNRRFKAELRSVINTVDETTRTQEVRLSLPKCSDVATGLSGRLEWSSKNSQIPADYILRRQNGLGVMVVERDSGKLGHAKFHSIVAAREGQPAITDLSGDVLIIDQNRYRVRNGQKVSWK